MAHVRPLALLLVLTTAAILGSSCSGATTTGESSRPTTAASPVASPPDPAADRSLAERVILDVDDLSYGWQVQKSTDGADRPGRAESQGSPAGGRCPTASDAFLVAQVDSPVFARRSPRSSIWSSVLTYRTERSAALALSEAAEESVQRCLAEVLAKETSADGKPTVSVMPLTVPQLGDGSAAIRATMSARIAGRRSTLYVDFSAVRAGRMVAVVYFASFTRPTDPVRRDALVATVARRMRPLMTSAPQARGAADSLRDAPPADIFLLALDSWSSGEPALLADRLERTFGLCVEVLEPHAIGKEFISPRRHQLDGELVGDQLAELRGVSPDSELVVGISGKDMFFGGAPSDRFAFTVWRPGYAVISTARMDPANVGGKGGEARMRERLWKMTVRYLGLSYFQLPRSSQPRSVLRAEIRSLADLDAMGSRLDPPGGSVRHGLTAAKERCTELRGPTAEPA